MCTGWGGEYEILETDTQLFVRFKSSIKGLLSLRLEVSEMTFEVFEFQISLGKSRQTDSR